MRSIGESEEKKLKALLRPLFEREEIVLVVLFGSRAAGTARSSSDLDLAILGRWVLDIAEITNTAIRLAGFSDVDLVDLGRASPTTSMAVARKGKLLYEDRPGRFASFCSLAARRFEDSRKMRAARVRSIRQFLRERGL